MYHDFFRCCTLLYHSHLILRVCYIYYVISCFHYYLCYCSTGTLYSSSFFFITPSKVDTYGVANALSKPISIVGFV